MYEYQFPFKWRILQRTYHITDREALLENEYNPGNSEPKQART